MPLNTIAEPHEVLAHLLQPLLRDQRLPALQLLAALHHLLLPLEHGQPGMVEVVPQLDALVVEVLVV